MKVIIVGRPNVGKSTLFNRIIKKRLSIVHDMPGVTRDVIESQAQWQGKSFTVMDTGGVIESGDYISQEVRKKVIQHLEKVDLILFVVDAKEGLTAQDQEIAKLLYPYKHKTILVVNKVDNKKSNLNAYDFYTLGFDEVYFVSAQHGKGVAELLDRIVRDIPSEEQISTAGGIKISFVGRPNVGKSSLVNAILGQERVIVSHIPGTTRDAVEIPFTYKGTSFILVDTAGVRRPSKVEYGVEFFSVGRSLKAIELSHVVCLVLDISEGVTRQDKRLAGLIERHYKGCVIVANKYDLVKVPKETVENIIRKELYFLDYAPVVVTSAIKGEGVSSILDEVLEVYSDYTKQHKTSFVNRAIQNILKEKPPPLYRGKEVKVYYSFQKSTAPPTVVVITNYVEGWKENYKRFFIRRLREELKLYKSPLRLELVQKEGGNEASKA